MVDYQLGFIDALIDEIYDTKEFYNFQYSLKNFWIKTVSSSFKRDNLDSMIEGLSQKTKNTVKSSSEREDLDSMNKGFTIIKDEKKNKKNCCSVI